MVRADAAANSKARRVGRQMFTAGGSDEQVADNGPNGHSVFTWTVLQGLDGRADLNGDGIITASELAAYVAPSVSSLSHQTPSFGNLAGSEGGDFIFELLDVRAIVRQPVAVQHVIDSCEETVAVANIRTANVQLVGERRRPSEDRQVAQVGFGTRLGHLHIHPVVYTIRH